MVEPEEKDKIVEEASNNSAPNARSSPSLDPAVPDAYSNNSEIIIGGTDIAIAFLQDIGFSSTQKAVVRIVMTHQVFMDFVSYCNTRAKFIQDAYGESIPKLGNKERPQEEIEQSIEDMWANKPVVARFEFASDEQETP